MVNCKSGFCEKKGLLTLKINVVNVKFLKYFVTYLLKLN